jgi:hypothetical protein
MYDPTNMIRRLAAMLFATAAAAIAVPAAYAGWDGPPDAIDRYNNPAVVWDGPPDAIDRYRENQQTAELLELSHMNFQGPPDAIDRYRENHPTLAPQTWLLGGSPDAIDRYLGRTATPAAVVSPDDGFDWGAFGIGVASMFGLALLLAGLGLGALAVRHRGGQLRTS